jgi:hypothetical protein
MWIGLLRPLTQHSIAPTASLTCEGTFLRRERHGSRSGERAGELGPSEPGVFFGRYVGQADPCDV